MAEPADAEHRDEVGRAGPCDLDRLVGRDAGAGERGGVERVDALGHRDDVAAVGDGVLAEPAVDRVAHVLLLEAERLPPRDTVVARAAGVAEPRHRDPVAECDLGHAPAELAHDADALVAGDERRSRLHRPVAVRGVDVGMAEARRLHLDQDLPRIEGGARDLVDRQARREVMDDGRAVMAGWRPERGRRVRAEGAFSRVDGSHGDSLRRDTPLMRCPEHRRRSGSPHRDRPRFRMRETAQSRRCGVVRGGMGRAGAGVPRRAGGAGPTPGRPRSRDARSTRRRRG